MKNKVIFFRILKKEGIAIIVLIMSILLLSFFAYVLSALIITKQKSAPLPFRSTQAFNLAQAGIEYAIRYTADHQADYWIDSSSIFPLTRNFGAGSFNVIYNTGDKSITSTGMAGTATRVVNLSLFENYLVGGWITPGGDPPHQGGGGAGEQKKIYVPIINTLNSVIYIYQIDLAKEGGQQPRLRELLIDTTIVWTGNQDISTDHDDPSTFDINPDYPFPSGETINIITRVQATSELYGTWYITIYYYDGDTPPNYGQVTIIFDI
jgi:hypothetical protein